MNFKRTSSYPFAIFVIASVLSDFADIDFRVEVSSESLVMISGVAVYDIKVMHFVEIMLSCISCVHATYSRVESATQDSGKSGFFEAFLICPLPAVFEMSLVFRLVVSSIQIVDSCFQASLHYGKVLIGESYVNNDFGLKTIE